MKIIFFFHIELESRFHQRYRNAMMYICDYVIIVQCPFDH
jgi:hypothetical protein